MFAHSDSHQFSHHEIRIMNSLILSIKYL